LTSSSYYIFTPLSSKTLDKKLKPKTFRGKQTRERFQVSDSKKVGAFVFTLRYFARALEIIHEKASASIFYDNCLIEKGT
jgi:hypothetical protein